MNLSSWVSTVIFVLLSISISISSSNGTPLNVAGTTVVAMGKPCNETGICTGDLVCSEMKDGICIPPETNDKCTAHWECAGMHEKCRDGICRFAQPGDMCGGVDLTCNPDMTCNEHICMVNYASAACTEDRQCTGALVCSEKSATCTKIPMSYVAQVLILGAIFAVGALYAVVYNNIEDDYITVMKPVQVDEATQEGEAIQDRNEQYTTQSPKPAPSNSPKWTFRIRPNAEAGSSNRNNNNNRIGRIFQRNSSYQSTDPSLNAGHGNHQ